MSQSAISEEWRPIEGLGHYEVSDLGRVRNGDGLVFSPGRARGYPSVCLCANGKRNHRKVHTLVLEAFVGPRPEGFWAAHRDGDRANNRATNLRWLTPADNIAERLVHGTNYKLDAGQRARARELRGEGWSYARIGRELGVSDTTISHTINGYRYRRKGVLRPGWKPRELAPAPKDG